MDIETILAEVKSYNLNTDIARVKQAFEFACLVHEGQKRLNGVWYIDHCLGVAGLLANLRADDDTLCAALLHDTLEYSNLKSQDLKVDFGETVAWLVEQVSETNPLDRSGVSSENLRKMFLAMAKDVRVVLIRLAEKLDNLKVVKYFAGDEGKIFCQRILDIYAPLAERLGVFIFKRQLEDAAFAYLYPEEYQQIFKQLSASQSSQERYVEQLRRKLLTELIKNGVKESDVFGRSKNVYSIYKKMQKKGVSDVKGLYDLIGVTILVETLVDCYSALGVIHGLFKHLPEEFDDYIHTPKPNGYQAIQTTVFASANKIVEIQIKTRQMHEYNEFGPASHVYYKLFGSGQKAASKKIDWVKELALWQKNVTSSEEFAQGLKLDFFADRIFCFTPKGDVKDLPEGATPIDFAYTVHSDLGNRVVAAKVNDKIMALNKPLKNGDVVELVLSKDNRKNPNRDWLKFVVTTRAKKEIKKFYLK